MLNRMMGLRFSGGGFFLPRLLQGTQQAVNHGGGDISCLSSDYYKPICIYRLISIVIVRPILYQFFIDFLYQFFLDFLYQFSVPTLCTNS